MKIFSIKMERKISLLNYLVLTRISYGGLGYVEERERGGGEITTTATTVW